QTLAAGFLLALLAASGAPCPAMRLQSRAPGGAAQPAPPSPTVFAARRQLVARLLAAKSEAERDALLQHPAAPVDDELVWNLAYAARDLQQHGAPRQEVDHALDV